MGCSTSTVLLEGLRSVLERNCAYVKGPAAAGASRGEEDEDEGGHGGAEPPSNSRGAYPWISNTALVTSRHACSSLQLLWLQLALLFMYHRLIIILISSLMSLCLALSICF